MVSGAFLQQVGGVLSSRLGFFASWLSDLGVDVFSAENYDSFSSLP